MSMTREEYWMGEARKFESWFYQANYARCQQEAENAKLRELVSILCYCMHESTDCDGCKLNDGAGRIEQLDAFWACDGLHERLRELGVDDG